jgi:hypothetical protein
LVQVEAGQVEAVKRRVLLREEVRREVVVAFYFTILMILLWLPQNQLQLAQEARQVRPFLLTTPTVQVVALVAQHQLER